MIRLSKLCDYAALLLECLARDMSALASATDLASASRLPEPTVAKVLKLLAAGGLVTSARGVNGGYQLARAADKITVQDIVCAIEGPVVLTACVENEDEDVERCALHGLCALTGRWTAVNDAVRGALSSVTLAHMMRGGCVMAGAVETVAGLGAAYDAGFVTDIETEYGPKGLNEDTIRLISAKKNEPAWLLDWRMKAYHHWLTMPEPTWAKLDVPAIDYQDAYYYAAPKAANAPKSLDEVDPKLLETYEKLGVPLRERAILAGVAVDAVFDSVSVATTFKAKLEEVGVIFCSISEAVQRCPDLVREYLGSVVPFADNKHACLNSAVFTDGSFVYIPPHTKCPMELSTYFRINAAKTGQFERTLIIADKGASVSYLEGCTAPQRDENQLHAAVVELIALDDADIKYSTVQNWYPGDADGKGGIWNFVTKRGICAGKNSSISWTQVETGSAITWKYPSCILKGEGSKGEFYSVAVTNGRQQADTGTKMIHLGANTTSKIISKGISAGRSSNTYRGMVKVMPKAAGAKNYTQCDSLLIGDLCGAHTVPTVDCRTDNATLEHEATTGKISADQLLYCQQRGLSAEEAVALIVNGFCREVLQNLPMEFAVEAQKLVGVSLEGSVG